MAGYDLRNLHLIELTDANLTVYIPPWMCNKVAAGVHDELDNSLLRYVDDQEAVLLAYNSVQITSKQALLASYLPYLAIEARANLLLFKPIPGKILVGRVHKLSAGLLGLLVLGGINAMIRADQMPQGFKFDAKNQCWVCNGDYNRAILMGDCVACEVLSVPDMDPDDEEQLFNLDATLLHPDAGLCAQQTVQQQQKRTQLAAAMSAVKSAAKQANGVSKSVGEDPKGKKKDRKRKEQKHRSKDKEHESSSKRRKRKSDDADGRQASKKVKHSISSDHQQSLPLHAQEPNGLLTPTTEAAKAEATTEPATPNAVSSKLHGKHKSKDSSLKHSSKKDRTSSSSSSKKHKNEQKQSKAVD